MLKLMTFNIRVGFADDRENIWDNRKRLVLDRIKAFDPDLLGLQECHDGLQSGFIKSHLQEYEFYGMPRGGNGATDLEMAPLLFKRSAFQFIQRGCFWFSETPQVAGSKSWGSAFPRTATWVELIHHASGRSIIFLNTHFDYEPSAIGKSARLLKQWIDQIVGENPLILMGDFNADKDSSAHQQLTSDASLLDVYREAHPSSKNDGTFHDYGRADKSMPIDWILASSHFEVINAEIDRYHEGNLYPSDHYPVTATLNWKGTDHAD